MSRVPTTVACLALLLAGCGTEGVPSPLRDGVSAVVAAVTGGGECTAADSETDPVDDGRWRSDPFDGDGPLIGYTTNNAASLPDVDRRDGRYRAVLTDNTGEITLHFNDRQGRLDARRLSFPFEFVVRNVGIGTLSDSQVPPSPNDFESPSGLYMFAGVQVHALDLDRLDSAHFVVGHRGSTSYTVEGKNTVDGRSAVNDAGQGIVPDGRADLRVIGCEDGSLGWYWQQPNPEPGRRDDDWKAYRGDGQFPGPQAELGEEVYVGLITYAYGSGSVPFVGTADSVEWIERTSSMSPGARGRMESGR